MAGDVESAPSILEADYFVVPLVPPIVEIMGNRAERGFPAAFRLRGYKPSIALKPGDVISITIFEVGPSPTFGGDFPPIRDGSIPARRQAQPARVGSGSDLDTAPSGTTPKRLAQGQPPQNPQPSPSPSPAPSAPVTPPPTASGPSVVRTLPPLIVEETGDIAIPYAGNVHVGGLTPSQAAIAIRKAISSVALNADVVVSLVSNGTNTATVGGEANRPGPVILTLRGERLLDAIGQAGGSKWPASDTDVDIVRGGTGARVKLQTIVENPGENIYVRPNDQVFLTHDPRSFTVLGASQKAAQYTFDVPRVSLAEAVARAGGSVDSIGNPAAVYLFREEPTPLAERVLTVMATLRPSEPDAPPAPLDPSRVKLVYKINMNSAEGYFLARRLSVLDKDVILIANAEGTQLLKLFTLVRGVTGAANDLNFFSPGGPLGGSARGAVIGR